MRSVVNARLAALSFVLIVAVLGCGSTQGTVTHTVVVTSGTGDSTTTTATSTTSTSTTTSPSTTSTSSQPTRVAAPGNLVATPQLKAALLDAVRVQQQRQNDTSDASLRIGGISGPVKGSTYLATWGDYEYADASFKHSSGPDFTDYHALFYRPPGGAWVAAAALQQGDVECNWPVAFDHVWGTGPTGCSTLQKEDIDRNVLVVQSVGQRFECATDTRSGRSHLNCWARDPGSFKVVKRASIGPTGGAGTRPSFAAPDVADDVAGFGIPYGLPTGDGSYSCTFDPTAVTCTSPSGRVVSLTLVEQ